MHCMYIPYHLHVLVDGVFRSRMFHPHELEANPIGYGIPDVSRRTISDQVRLWQEGM